MNRNRPTTEARRAELRFFIPMRFSPPRRRAVLMKAVAEATTAPRRYPRCSRSRYEVDRLQTGSKLDMTSRTRQVGALSRDRPARRPSDVDQRQHRGADREEARSPTGSRSGWSRSAAIVPAKISGPKMPANFSNDAEEAEELARLVRAGSCWRRASG